MVDQDDVFMDGRGHASRILRVRDALSRRI
jgi:hypothetical protein